MSDFDTNTAINSDLSDEDIESSRQQMIATYKENVNYYYNESVPDEETWKNDYAYPVGEAAPAELIGSKYAPHDYNEAERRGHAGSTIQDSLRVLTEGTPEEIRAHFQGWNLDESAKSDLDATLVAISGARDPQGVKDLMDAAEAAAAARDTAKKNAEEQKEKDAAEARKRAEEAARKAAAAADRKAAKKFGLSPKSVEFKEQCFLLAKLFELSKYKMEIIDGVEVKPLPYVDNGFNASLLLHGDPYAMMNRLTQHPSQRALMELTPAQISSLQPKIRLYKISTDEEGNETEQEINFDSSATQDDLTSLLKSQAKRGFGAGIKDFTFSYEGNNPFAVKKSIKANLRIFANSFDELTKDRGGYSYIELALKTGGNNAKIRGLKEQQLNPAKADEVFDNLVKLNFRLKAVVGWATPPVTFDANATEGPDASGIFNMDVIDAINDSFVTLNLTPTIHTFDFDESGRVNFSIQYLAYVEDFFDTPYFSIFNDLEATKHQLERKLKYSSLSQKCDSKTMSEIKKDDLQTIADDKQRMLNHLYNSLSIKGKLRYISVPYSKLKDFNTEGPYYDMDKEGQGMTIGTLEASQRDKLRKEITKEIKDNAAEQSKDKKKKSKDKDTKAVKSRTNDPNSSYLAFFYLSDLIDVIMEGIDKKFAVYDNMIQEIMQSDQASKGILDPAIIAEEMNKMKRLKENYERLRIVLGPVEIVNPVDASDSAFLNLGDMPVSVRYFMEWLTERTLKKDRIIYPLTRFMNDVINIFLKSFLNDDTCFSGTTKQRVRLNQASLTDYKIDLGPTSAQIWYKPQDVGSESVAMDTITEQIVNKRMAVGADVVSRLDLTSQTRVPLLHISGTPGTPIPAGAAKHETNYLIYYAARTQPVERMIGDITSDSRLGIHHYMLGRPTGIVKNITLNRTDAPGLKELRFEQQGYDGLAQLREVYDVTIDCYANVGAFPGTYIFVDPRGWAPNLAFDPLVDSQPTGNFDVDDLTQYGIGGYFMIVRSEHSFGEGKANSVITAKWVAGIDKELPPNTTPVPKKAETVKKCYAAAEGSNPPPAPPVPETESDVSDRPAKLSYFAQMFMEAIKSMDLDELAAPVDAGPKE